jgi:hypothetical protein
MALTFDSINVWMNLKDLRTNYYVKSKKEFV